MSGCSYVNSSAGSRRPKAESGEQRAESRRRKAGICSFPEKKEEQTNASGILLLLEGLFIIKYAQSRRGNLVFVYLQNKQFSRLHRSIFKAFFSYAESREWRTENKNHLDQAPVWTAIWPKQ
jgi:hypothetical protein